jgi:hypothetical protein
LGRSDRDGGCRRQSQDGEKEKMSGDAPNVTDWMRATETHAHTLQKIKQILVVRVLPLEASLETRIIPEYRKLLRIDRT